jgi:hypothetical protein
MRGRSVPSCGQRLGASNGVLRRVLRGTEPKLIEAVRALAPDPPAHPRVAGYEPEEPLNLPRPANPKAHQALTLRRFKLDLQARQPRALWLPD